MRTWLLGLLMVILLALFASGATAQEALVYDIGAPVLTQVWVDPLNGDDSADGLSRETALGTLAEAWNRIPMGTPLTTGYQITLLPGTYPPDAMPNYWESRYGTHDAPIIIQSAEGADSVVLGSMNVFDTRYLYLIDLTLESGDMVFHCERCDHMLIRGSTVRGLGSLKDFEAPHETVKMNQSQYIYLEDNDILHAYENAVDFVAVQYGHIVRNRIYEAGDWCIYLKGGSAYFTVADNEIFDCWTGGFTAGQGTGLEYMVAPWLHYEAYDIRFINNVVHDTFGAGFGVNGGYNILLAHNTLYRVGERSHVLEFVFGGRSCDENLDACAANMAAGAWGTLTMGEENSVLVPNRNVYVYNNIILNPEGFQSEWQHFTIYGAQGDSVTDSNLQIRGNVIWNGDADMPLGVGDDQGCQPENPTCNADQLVRDNAINTVEPRLADPENGDYRVLAESVAAMPVVPIPDFTWDDAPAGVPPGDLSNAAVGRTVPGASVES